MPKIPCFISKPMPRKAALRASPAIDEPNLVIPLATSYNERGVAGFTHAVTNSEDQRKINCIYELAKNVMTGKGTLTLSKRPGVTIEAGTSYGSSTQNVYLVILLNSSSGFGKSIGSFNPVVINISGGNIRASLAGVNTTIVAAGNLLPAYIDKTLISNVENIVIQLKDTFSTGNPQRAFFSTNATVWTEITDVDFTALIHCGKMEHMDGYAFILESQNRIFNSDTNSLANWTATSFITKQIIQDSPVGLAKLNNQILAFGDDTVEMFYNAGNTTGSPLLPVRHLHQRIGLIPPSIRVTVQSVFGHYYCTIGNKIFFVGRDSGGVKAAGVFSYNGQNIEKISSRYIDKILSEVVNTSFYSVNTIGHHGQKGMSILLTSPNATSQRSLVFYPDWNEWFEHTSTVFSHINDGEHFLSCGTSLKDRLYTFSSADNWEDAGTSYSWSTQFKLPTNGSAQRFMPMYGVDADTDTSANNLTVEISTDDSKTFSTLGTIDQTQDRKVLFRGGSFRKAHIRLSNTNARPTRIHNFLARIE